MKEFNINEIHPNAKELKEEEFRIPNEGCCSAEFPEGCILVE